MQNPLFARQSPAAAPVGGASCAICQVTVDFAEQPVAHLSGAVFAHENCAWSFACASTSFRGSSPRSGTRF